MATAEASVDVKSLCLHELFDSQAEQTPEATAIGFGDESITFEELKQHAPIGWRITCVIRVLSRAHSSASAWIALRRWWSAFLPY